MATVLEIEENNQSQKTSLRMPIQVILKTLLRLSFYCWTIPINIFFEKYLYFKIKSWRGENKALIVYLLMPLILLLITLLLKFLKKGKALSIFFGLCYTVKTCFVASKAIIHQVVYFKSVSGFFFAYWQFLGLIVLSGTLSYLAILYLWKPCGYREIIAFHKITLLQEISGWMLRLGLIKLKKIFDKGILTVNFLVKGVARKEILFSIIPIIVIYGFFINTWKILPLQASSQVLINYGLLELVPILTLLIGLFLYWIKWDKGFFVVSSILMNGYGLYKTLPICFAFYLKPIIKVWPNLIKIYQVLLISFKVSMFLAIVCEAIKLGLVLGAIFYYLHALVKNMGKKTLKRTIHYGSAKFLDKKGIKRLINRDGIVIGAIPKDTNFNNLQKVIQNIKEQRGDELIRIKTSHTTLIAPSRSGKGTGVIVPTLLSYPGPVFVTDIKGENYLITKRARKKQGRKVYAFDPFNITADISVRINPLEFLDPNSKNIVDNAKTFAYLLCPTPSNVSSNTLHFKEKAADIIQCLLLYVVCSEDIPAEEKTLSRIYDLLCLEYEELMFLFKDVISSQVELAYGTPARLANSILGTHPEERSGAFSTAKTALSFVDTPYIREATKSSDILLSHITKGDLDLFICIPPKYLEAQIRLLRLLTGIVFMSVQDAGGNIGKHNLLMLLDEMPALGHMKQVIDILTYGAGYGVSLMVISQTIGLLKSVYPEWDMFFSNELSLFFGCSDQMTAKLVAEKIGKQTIEVSSTNQGTSAQQRSGKMTTDSSTQHSGSSSETGRELLMAEEIQWLYPF